MGRFLFTYSYTGEAEQDLEAENEQAARAAIRTVGGRVMVDMHTPV